jgi:hypothetical protein
MSTMLSLFLRYAKKALLVLLIGTMIAGSIMCPTNKSELETMHISCAIENYERQCEIIVRAGEYEGKAGKRIYVNNCTVNLPDDIPVRNDGDGKGFYVSEWDINVKESKALIEKLQANGINAKLQIAHSKSEDLNAAGRIANKSNPKLYISIHHNYHESNSTGYFSMYNPDNEQSEQLAIRLSNAIENNSQVPRRNCRPNTGYIGEMNVINDSTIPVLLELGFFSNIEELEQICSDSYVDYVSSNLAKEITLILNEN